MLVVAHAVENAASRAVQVPDIKYTGKRWSCTINTHHHGSDGQSVGWLENGQRIVTPAAAIGVGVAPESGALVVDAAS